VANTTTNTTIITIITTTTTTVTTTLILQQLLHIRNPSAPSRAHDAHVSLQEQVSSFTQSMQICNNTKLIIVVLSHYIKQDTL